MAKAYATKSPNGNASVTAKAPRSKKPKHKKLRHIHISQHHNGAFTVVSGLRSTDPGEPDEDEQTNGFPDGHGVMKHIKPMMTGPAPAPAPAAAPPMPAAAPTPGGE